MIAQFFARLRAPRHAANEPSLQLGLPFGPLPVPSPTASSRLAPPGLAALARPARRIEPSSPVPAVMRRQGQGPVLLRSALPASSAAVAVSRSDAAQAGRTVIVGRLAAVCEELDRLVAAEQAACGSCAGGPLATH